ncbi:sensor histidine kinase [Actinoplanes sichuanensis]|uniref:histidine kinase n=1 Tax=Actinoplanes sichuanensis TaxID=512349 RepID=A0ABW4A1T5_9ACTN
MRPMRDRVSCEPGKLGDPQRILAAALQAYVAIDITGRVIGWNQAAEDIFGYPFDHACGADLADLIIPVAGRPAHLGRLARLTTAAPDRILGEHLKMTAVHRDGHEFPIEVTLTATKGPAGTVLHAFAHDITTAQRVSRFAAVEAAVSRGLVEAASSGDAAARVVEALGVKMGWPVAELWLADEHRNMIDCAARYTTGRRRLGAFAIDTLEPGVGLPGRVYQRATADWITDLAADGTSFRSRAAAKAGLHVAIGVPVSIAGRAMGSLCVYGDRIEDPEDTVTVLLGGIAAQVAQYLERRRAEELTVELARTKDEFLALVTHELRNPLAVIAAAAAMLEEDFTTAPLEQREHLRTIARNTQRLSLITEDLLDLARLEAGDLAINTCDTDLCAIIDEAVQTLAAAARDKNLAVSVRIPACAEVHADPNRLRQVADNLLSNAIKYTPDGGSITITVETGEHEIVWSVADTGIGVPRAERPNLFRRFYRTTAAVQHRIPGTGLGLVITRTIIERHHGSIILADTTGPGTTFVIRLPIKAPLP